MSGELLPYYSAVARRAKALLEYPLQYYLKDRPLNTIVIYALIKAIVLLSAVLISLRYQPLALFQNPSGEGPIFLTKWDGLWYQGIARQGYAFKFPSSAAFPPMYPFLIKIFSLNQPALMSFAGVLISNAFSFLGLFFLYKLVPLILDEKYRLRVCFAYMVFPVLLVCNLVSYTEPVFLAFTIGAYYFWKQEKFGYAALLAIFSIFTRDVGLLILVIFFVDMLYGYASHRERSRTIRELASIAITAAGVASLYLFYLYRFGNPFISAQVEAATPGWHNSVSIANIPLNLVSALAGLKLDLVNYSAVPIILIDSLVVLATVLFFLRRDLALSAYSFASLVLFLSLSNIGGFMRFVAAIFPIYLFFGLMLSQDDWKKNITVGVIAIIVAIQNMYIWISGTWLY
ncbi:MAG: hypothetical protein ACXV2F_01580 [Halobacteriota archaeon]